MAWKGEDYFQELADGAPVMIWMSGLDLGCFYFNRTWLDFRGRTLEEESGNGWAEGVHPDDLQRCVNHYVACFERRVAFAMSYRLLNAAGEYRWILDRGAPHSLPDGAFLGFFGGCAEIDDDSTVARNAELGSSLHLMRDFAQRIAAEAAATSRVLRAGSDPALQVRAREIHEAYLERLRCRQRAVSELERLAADMVSYGGIPRGACLP